MDKLTNEEIAKVFSFYGIDAPILTIDGKAKVLTIHAKAVTVSLDSIKHGQNLHGIDEGNGGLHRTYLNKDNQCNLLLTQLSKITDEHAIEVVNVALRQSKPLDDISKVITENNMTTVWHTMSSIRTVIFWEDLFWAEDRNEGRSPVELPYPAYQHLISLRYNVPLHFGFNHWANGKTAIELGIAIEKI